MKPRTKRIILLTLVAVVIATLLTIDLVFPREPSFEGKSLSAWIAPFCVPSPTGFQVPAGRDHFEALQPVRHAVSQLGTNALPFLIAKLEYRESSFQRSVRQFTDRHPLLGIKLADPTVHRIRAIRALAILGPAAQPAIPSMTAHLNDPSLSKHVIYTLSGAGPEGFRTLVDGITNAPPTVRDEIASMLIMPAATYRGENVRFTNEISFDLAVNGLGRAAQFSSATYRLMACQRLANLGPAASNAVPALLLMVDDRATRQMAIRTLGAIKSRPDLVVPVLTNLLADPDRVTQKSLAIALEGFGYKLPAQP